MKRTKIICSLLSCALITLVALVASCQPSRAASLSRPTTIRMGYVGHLDLKAPIWNSRTNLVNSSLPVEICGKLNLTNAFGNSGVASRISPFIAGDYTLGRHVFATKAELQAGIEVLVARQVTFFSYWDRHFQENVDRAFVGLRFSFSGGGS